MVFGSMPPARSPTESSAGVGASTCLIALHLFARLLALGDLGADRFACDGSSMSSR